jgi:hypothetical protein
MTNFHHHVMSYGMINFLYFSVPFFSTLPHTHTHLSRMAKVEQQQQHFYPTTCHSHAITGKTKAQKLRSEIVYVHEPT